MAQFDVSLSLDTAVVRPMLEKFCGLASRLGLDETERRTGCAIDEAYLWGLMAIEEAGRSKNAVHFRMVPTAEFDRVIAALSV
jgi:hypothetical protein